MAIQTIDVGPLDANAYTGPTRVMAGVARTGDVVLNTLYGNAGVALERARWLYIGVSGNVSYVKWDGTTQVLIGVVAGMFHPIFSVMINSVGTTATNIVWGS